MKNIVEKEWWSSWLLACSWKEKMKKEEERRVTGGIGRWWENDEKAGHGLYREGETIRALSLLWPIRSNVAKRHCSSFPFLEIRRVLRSEVYKQPSIKACCECLWRTCLTLRSWKNTYQCEIVPSILITGFCVVRPKARRDSGEYYVIWHCDKFGNPPHSSMIFLEITLI